MARHHKIALGIILAGSIAQSGTAQLAAALSTDAPLTNDTASTLAPVDPAAVAAIVSTIETAVTALAEGAREDDIAAAISLAFSQTGQPVAVGIAALEQAAAAAQAGTPLARAIATVLTSLRRGNVGTGALAEDQSFDSGELEMSLGGGDSNYT